MTFISLNMIEGRSTDEDGLEVETSKPCLINADLIRCLYARRDGKPGARLTFNDGGGFAVSETADVIVQMLGRSDLVPQFAALPEGSRPHVPPIAAN